MVNSIAVWKQKAESERRKAELATAQAQNAVAKLMHIVQTEGETLLGNIRSGTHIPSVSSNSSSSPHSAMHPGGTHPSHLSRRVSFNRDINIVMSPEIGQSTGGCDPISSLGEEDELVGSSSSCFRPGDSTDVGDECDIDAADQERRRHANTRRLSRSEVNEGAILKEHLDLNQLEKENLESQLRQ